VLFILLSDRDPNAVRIASTGLCVAGMRLRSLMLSAVFLLREQGDHTLKSGAGGGGVRRSIRDLFCKNRRRTPYFCLMTEL